VKQSGVANKATKHTPERESKRNKIEEKEKKTQKLSGNWGQRKSNGFALEKVSDATNRQNRPCYQNLPSINLPNFTNRHSTQYLPALLAFQKNF